MFEQISKKTIGHRVKLAREKKGWTQEQLARALDLKDRQIISNIELGARVLQAQELIILTEIFEIEPEYFLDPFAVVDDARFSWRASETLSEKSLDAFELKAGKWINLFLWLRKMEQESINPLKFSLRLSKQSRYEDAIICAENLVTQLELGLIPADNLQQKIECQLGIPILFFDLNEADDSISGATCNFQNSGVILINRNETEGRRLYDLAHELFHALTWDIMPPAHRESNSNRINEKRVEQLANNFAAGLLMPESSLRHFIDQTKIMNVNHLLEIATSLKVTSEALAWRLYNLGWINKNICDELKNIKQRVFLSNKVKPFSVHFVNLLQKAIDNGNLSARKASKVMGMNLSELTNLFIEHNLTVPFEL